MKKIFTLLIAATIVAMTFASNAESTLANSSFQHESEISNIYEETTIEILNINTKTLLKAKSSSSSISGRKTTSYKNSSGKILWSVSVTATFTYNGKTAVCTASSVSTSISDSSWSISSSGASKSGASATATATAKKYYNSKSTLVSTSVTLTCSKTGSLN